MFRLNSYAQFIADKLKHRRSNRRPPHARLLHLLLIERECSYLAPTTPPRRYPSKRPPFNTYHYRRHPSSPTTDSRMIRVTHEENPPCTVRQNANKYTNSLKNPSTCGRWCQPLTSDRALCSQQRPSRQQHHEAHSTRSTTLTEEKELAITQPTTYK